MLHQIHLLSLSLCPCWLKLASVSSGRGSGWSTLSEVEKIAVDTSLEGAPPTAASGMSPPPEPARGAAPPTFKLDADDGNAEE